MTRRQSKTTRAAKAAARHPEYKSRDFLLAGIGAVSLGRKQAIQSYADAVQGVGELRERVQDAFENANSQIGLLRKQARTRIAAVQKQVETLGKQAKGQAQVRLAPVLAKLGVKPAAKKPAARKAVKRVAKRARRAA